MSNALELRKTTLPISAELNEVMEQLRENINAIGSFRIPRIKATSSGLQISEDIEPAKTMQGVLIYAKKTKSYYKKAYKAGEVTLPDCFSNDWKKPAPEIAAPQSKECKGCPQNEFGSNNMESGKACRDLRPLYFVEILEGGKVSPIPQMLLITPTSLKALDNYLLNLTQKLKHFRGVETKVTWAKEHPDDKYGLLTFAVVKDISKEVKQDVDGLLQMWLPIMDAQAIEQDEVPVEAAPIERAKGGEF
jgi:hypothetical protein